MARPEIFAPPAVRAVYLSGKGLFEGTKTDPARWEAIASLASQDPVFYRDALQKGFGRAIGGRIAETGLRGVPPDAALTTSCRRWRRVEWIRSPARRTAHAALEARRIARRALFPTGLIVLVVGPDGAGKSTFARGLMSSTDTLFRRREHVHWTPGMLPRLSQLLGRPTGDVTRPHARRLHSVPTSHLALAYYWLDNFVGGWFVLRHVRRRTGLVVIERGWWDIAVDPRRYRMRVAPRLVRLLGLALAAPDVVFSLEGPADVFASRKGELPYEEVEKQLLTWRELAPRVAPTVHVTAIGPVEHQVAEAREHIAQRLEARTAARIGSGWLVPGSRRARFLLPRGPVAVATTGLQIYQPMTIRGRLAWETARLTASTGAFRLSPRGQAPPHPVREILSRHIPRGGTAALQRTNHQDRWVALVIDAGGRARKLIKLSTAVDGVAALHREADSLARFAGRLAPPLRAPRLLEAAADALVFEPVDWRPRRRPWELPPDVAYAMGCFALAGANDGTVAHGDFAPWNLLMSRDGWTLIDWEKAGSGYPAMFDLFHYLVQSHCLLGRPSRDEIVGALVHRRGAVARTISCFLTGMRADVDALDDGLVRYLDASRDTLDSGLARHEVAIRARDRLLAATIRSQHERRLGGTPQGA